MAEKRETKPGAPEIAEDWPEPDWAVLGSEIVARYQEVLAELAD